MRLQLTSDGHFPKRELREIVNQSKRVFVRETDDPPKSFEVIVRAVPRRRKIKCEILNQRAVLVEIPAKVHLRHTRGSLARDIAYFMYFAYHPRMESHRTQRVFRLAMSFPASFHADDFLFPAEKPQKIRPGPKARYEKCAAQVTTARERVREHQDRLVRAERHLEKKTKEAMKLKKVLDTIPSGRTPDNLLRDQLKEMRG